MKNSSKNESRIGENVVLTDVSSAAKTTDKKLTQKNCIGSTACGELTPELTG